MSSPSRLRLQPDDRLTFFQGFLKRPRQVGSILPSSRFLERRITRAAHLDDAQLVVELGPGTGGTTRALLRAMKPTTRLLSIEINPHFVSVLQRTRDPRLIVHCGSALDLCQILEERALPAPDAVLSGIPFSTMARPLGRQILCAVHDALEPGGHFVAYQVRDRVESLGCEVFGDASVQTELFNVPPMRVYHWVKSA
jgi:phosphatidylethanolamine/phosphatidyl-N-methylethanolamine N-methyltransferase